jgi:hypothetical protein
MNVVFSCENTDYMCWQAQFLQFTYAKTKMNAKLTCLVSTTEDSMRDFLCPTVEVSNYSGLIRDVPFPPLNKPGGINEWIHREPQLDEAILIVDPDTVFIRQVIEPPDLRPGFAYGQEHPYMNSDLPSSRTVLKRHCKIKARRIVQPIGIYALIHRDDLVNISPVWLEKTLEIKSDVKCARALPDNGWISDMWAYAIAAAELGIVHQITDLAQVTGSNCLSAPLIHYCFPLMKDKKVSWTPGCNGILWSKWNYEPWRVPPVGRSTTVEGRILLGLLREFATSRRL